MSRQRFYDVPDGDTILYDIVDESNGYRQSTFQFEEKDRSLNFRKIKDLRCRDDDVFLHSYPKTGQVGDWKNWFTVAQSEMFDAWWEKETKGFEICEFEFS